MKADQSLSEFQTGISAAADATVNTEQLIHARLPLLILFPLYQILREELFLFQKCVDYLSRFMTFWTMMCPNELVTQFVF